MIDPKELRVGCWFNLKNPMSGELIHSQFLNWTEALEYEAYGEPIPLTPEWLSKLGFKHINDRNRYGWYKELLQANRYLNWCSSSEISIENTQADELLTIECESVHQLQNLYYSLTGKELEITNP